MRCGRCSLWRAVPSTASLLRLVVFLVHLAQGRRVKNVYVGELIGDSGSYINARESTFRGVRATKSGTCACCHCLFFCSPLRS